MDPKKLAEARDAWERIDDAIGDQDRTITTVTVDVPVDAPDDADPDAPLPTKKMRGQRVAHADVVANDVVKVGGAIPLERRSQKVKELRRGCARVEPERTVMCQCACLHQLLQEAKPYLFSEKEEPRPAAEPKPEPAKAEPESKPEPVEESKPEPAAAE